MQCQQWWKLAVVTFDAGGGGPETRQQLGVALVNCIQGATYI